MCALIDTMGCITQACGRAASAPAIPTRHTAASINLKHDLKSEQEALAAHCRAQSHLPKHYKHHSPSKYQTSSTSAVCPSFPGRFLTPCQLANISCRYVLYGDHTVGKKTVPMFGSFEKIDLSKIK